MNAYNEKDLPALADVVKQLKVPLEELRPSNVFTATAQPPVLLEPAAGADKVQAVKALAKVAGLRDADGELITFALSWTCAADKRNFLTVNNTPFVARYISYSFSNITWQAGNGWPVYGVRCPREDYGQDMNYPHAKVHSLVLEIGSRYDGNCSHSSFFAVEQLAQVIAAVNDEPRFYGDNRGIFVLTITGYSS